MSNIEPKSEATLTSFAFKPRLKDTDTLKFEIFLTLK